MIEKEAVTGHAFSTSGAEADLRTPTHQSSLPLADCEELVAGMALEVWRLGRRLDRLAETLPPESTRSVLHSRERLEEHMAMNGLEIQNHDGEKWIEGLQFEVVHRPADAKELIVTETIQPTVRLNERIILQGQVVLGQAVTEGEDGQ